MADNASEFPELLRWALRHHIKKLSVSNVLPHTEEMRQQILYRRCLCNLDYGAEVQLPRLDCDPGALKLIQAVLSDTALMDALRAGDLNAVTSNPKFMRLLENPAVQEIMKGVR